MEQQNEIGILTQVLGSESLARMVSGLAVLAASCAQMGPQIAAMQQRIADLEAAAAAPAPEPLPIVSENVWTGPESAS